MIRFLFLSIVVIHRIIVRSKNRLGFITPFPDAHDACFHKIWGVQVATVDAPEVLNAIEHELLDVGGDIVVILGVVVVLIVGIVISHKLILTYLVAGSTALRHGRRFLVLQHCRHAFFLRRFAWEQEVQVDETVQLGRRES